MDNIHLCAYLNGMEENNVTVGSSTTFVRYNDPILVDQVNNCSANVNTKRLEVAGASLDTKHKVQEVVNSIVPPRCWEESGNMWQQTVSCIAATKEDVINLREMMDAELEKEQANNTGFCFKRREIHSKCFDELIRQVSINCVERGLLLLRIRDEINMTFDAFARKYCDEISYGVLKCLEDREEKNKLNDRIRSLEAENELLEQNVISIQAEMDENARRDIEIRAEAKKKYDEEVVLLKKTRSQLKAQLQNILSSKK